jgi:hypothetical protein
MKDLPSFEDFITNQSIQISIWGFVANLLLTAILAFILNLLYSRFGSSLSNRKQFADNFVIIALTTMIIITIVKSSLALSLGLVGALSIVRFRAAIKEPEELSYIFLTIAIGLGMGANQRLSTIIGFSFVSLIIILLNLKKSAHDEQNLQLVVSSLNDNESMLENILSILNRHCETIDLKRVDEGKEYFEAVFLVHFNQFDGFNEAKIQLRKLDPDIKLSFLDDKGIV